MEDTVTILHMLLHKKNVENMYKIEQRQRHILRQLILPSKKKGITILFRRTMQAWLKQYAPAKTIEKQFKHQLINDNIEFIFQQQYEQIHKSAQSWIEFLNEPKVKQVKKAEWSFQEYMESAYNAMVHSTNQFKEYIQDCTKLYHNRTIIRIHKRIFHIIQSMFLPVSVSGIDNIPKKGPCIIAPYHYHPTHDIIMLNALIKRNLFTFVCEMGFIKMRSKWLAKRIGWLPVKRAKERFGIIKKKRSLKKFESFSCSNKQTTESALIHLKYGNALLVFPEGDSYINGTFHRSRTDKFIEPKKGVAVIAYKAEKRYGKRIPIIPIGIVPPGLRNKHTKINIGNAYYLDEKTMSKNEKDVRKDIQRETNELFNQIKQLSSPY